LGSRPATKKVQSIYEETQRIREAEEFQEIELGWKATAQRSLGHSPRAVASEGALDKAPRGQQSRKALHRLSRPERKQPRLAGRSLRKSQPEGRRRRCRQERGAGQRRRREGRRMRRRAGRERARGRSRCSIFSYVFLAMYCEAFYPYLDLYVHAINLY